MLRAFSLGALLCLSLGALAEDANVDGVLKTPAAVSGEKLDEAAEQLISQTDSTGKPVAAKPAPSAVASKVAPEKTTSESQIPVFKDEKTNSGASGSPWMRLVGCAIVVIMVAGVTIVGIKKAARKRNIGGKKVRIEVLHQHFLGPKKSLALIHVAGEAILIGVTDHSINMIKPVALIDDEVTGQQQFNGFLDDEFVTEQLAAIRSGSRVV
jgi:flagellar protein FliO/FliZ